MKTTGFSACSKAAMVLSCMLLFACNTEDSFDYPNQEKTGNINFGVATDKGVRLKSSAGSGGQAYTMGRFVLHAEESDDSLCVRCVVEDGIAGNRRTDSCRQVVSRGTPVTDAAALADFHVLAYWKNNGTLMDPFYMNENVTKGTDNVWRSSNVYYWPGTDHKLQFYAFGPKDVPVTPPASSATTGLAYTVPAAVADQKDLVVATTDEYPGNHNAQVPLTFTHACTQVCFAIGGQMQPGTIKSIALKGVYSSGTYDMASATWTLDETQTSDFSLPTLDFTTTGTEAKGTPITEDDNTFMLLPQDLPAGAEVEIVFEDQISGARTLTASLAGSQWPMGKTVTYLLSIKPEYEFELTETPTLDAHYEIVKTRLKVSGIPSGVQWTVTAPTLGGETATILLQRQLNSYAQQGFWTDRQITYNDMGNETGNVSARGAATFSGTGEGEFDIAIFVPENTGDASRNVDLTINVQSGDVTLPAQTITLEQLAPSWNNGTGCERIQGPDSPWGFYWSSDYKIIYDVKGCSDNDRESIRQYIQWTKTLYKWSQSTWLGWLVKLIFGNDIPNLSFVDMTTSTIGSNWWDTKTLADQITINLGQLGTDNIALAPNDGQSNTLEMYNFNGIQLVNEIINRIHNMPGYTVTTEGTGEMPTNNAAITCMKLNSWNINIINDESALRLKDDKPAWYLPASGEVNGIQDADYPLNGNYWSSTAAPSGNEEAYQYDAAGTTSLEKRNVELHVRGVRKRP